MPRSARRYAVDTQHIGARVREQRAAKGNWSDRAELKDANAAQRSVMP